MPVTNFTSVVSTQSGGSGDVDKLAGAFDKLSDSINKANDGSKKLSEHPGFNDFAAKVKSGIQDPLGAIGSAAESALQSLGPVGSGVAAAGAVFVGFAAASYEAAKALGSYATEISNTAIRTGLTTREVQQFSFAARVSGQDVSVFEQAMRKLSQGLDENNETGSKARKGLVALGVSAADSNGQLRPMSDIFIQISRGLNAIEDPAKRNSAALEIFGRTGIQLLPTLLGLNDQIERAKSLGGLVGPSDSEIAKFKAYQEQVVELDFAWEKLKRDTLAPIAAIFSLTVKGATGEDFSDIASKAIKSQIGKTSPQTLLDRLEFAGQQGAVDSTTFASLQSLIQDQLNKQIAGGFSSGLSIDGSAVGARANSALAPVDDQGQLTAAKKKLDEMQGALRAELELHKSISDAELTSVENQKALVLSIEAQIKAAKDLESAKKSIATLDKESSDMSAKAFGSGDKYGTALAELRVRYNSEIDKYPQASERGSINASFEQQFYAVSKTAQDEARKSMEKFNELMLESPKIIDEATAKLAENFKKTAKNIEELGIGTTFGLKAPPPPSGYISPEQQLRDARDNERRGLGLFGAQAQLSGQTEAQQANSLAALRKSYADAEFEALKRKADISKDQAALQDALDTRHQKYLDAEVERQQTLLQLALAQKQQFQQTVVGFVDALRSGSTSQFFKGLVNTFEDKVISNIAGLGFADISKALPHANSGFLGKALAGTPLGADPLKDATVQNTLATLENSAELRAARTAALSPSGGGGGVFRGGIGNLAGAGGIFSDLPLTHPSGINDLSLSPAFGADIFSAPKSSSLFSAKNIGSVVAGAGAAFGAYESFKAGGAKGAIGGIGALTGGAALLDPEPISKAILAGVSIASGLLVSVFPALDPKAQRAKDLQNQAQSRAFNAPVGANYSGDTYGGTSSYDFQGNLRPIVVNIQTFDTSNFHDYLQRNPTAISAGITNAIQGGNAEDMLASIRQVG